MVETRAEFLARVAEEHYQWEEQNLDAAPFEPDDPQNAQRPDYNMWYLDMSPDPSVHQALADAIGEPNYVDDGSLPDTPDADAPVQPKGGG